MSDTQQNDHDETTTEIVTRVPETATPCRVGREDLADENERFDAMVSHKLHTYPMIFMQRDEVLRLIEAAASPIPPHTGPEFTLIGDLLVLREIGSHPVTNHPQVDTLRITADANDYFAVDFGWVDWIIEPTREFRSLPFGMMDLRIYEDGQVWLTDDDGRDYLRVEVDASASDEAIQNAADEVFHASQNRPVGRGFQMEAASADQITTMMAILNRVTNAADPEFLNLVHVEFQNAQGIPAGWSFYNDPGPSDWVLSTVALDEEEVDHTTTTVIAFDGSVRESVEQN